MIGAEGTKTPAGVRGWGDPGDEGSSPARPLPGAPINRLVENPMH
ncbi:hypothetical protein [Neobacillus muris]|nr:hypothetical protein [Neobacillus muris]